MSKDWKDGKFLLLTTFRKNGEGVPTIVWFVREGEDLLVRTGADSGKVKRIRNQAEVKVVPCGPGGRPHGPQLEAQASLLDDPAQAEQLEVKLRKKYGLQKKLVDFVLRVGGKTERAYLRLVLS